jgi:hypothetical protein
MPNTLIPIQTYTLTGTTASVTFSNIPQNYTDLKVVVNARTDRASVNDIMLLSFNGSTASFSARYLEGNGSSAGAYSDQARGFGNAAGANATSNTFGNTELYIPNYAGSTNKSWSGDGVNETSATAAFSSLFAGLWSSTAAITSIALTGNSSNFVSGSTFTLYGVSNGVKAVGGTLTVAGGYAYHTFTSTGSFMPNQKIKNAEVLAVAGGGGGAGTVGGGGGAGGVLYRSSQTLNAGNSYTALVGSGGSGGATQAKGTSGSNSVFSSSVATGGGGGGRGSGADANGLAGGSGGGAYSTGSVGAGTSGQGNNGGTGVSMENSGGGGGAGAAGANATATVPGIGGIGTSLYTTWHSITSTGVLSGGVYYIAGGGGGGGFSYNGGIGGAGGGGTGGSSGGAAGTAATANTGGGGGGATYNNSTQYVGGAGGSGLIIVRYPLS